MSGLKRADELLLRDLKEAVDKHGLGSLAEDDQLVFSLLNDRYDKFLDEGLKKLRGTPTQKRGLLSSIFNRGPQVPSSERRKARMSMAVNNSGTGGGPSSPPPVPFADSYPPVSNDSLAGLQMTNLSFFDGNAPQNTAVVRTDSSSTGLSVADTTPQRPASSQPVVDPTAWFSTAVNENEHLGKHWTWVLPNLVVGAIPFAAPTRDTPGHLSELSDQCSRRHARIVSVISCLGLDEPVGPAGFATARDWGSILSVSTFINVPIPADRDAVLVEYEKEVEGATGDHQADENSDIDPQASPPRARKVTPATLTLFEDVLAACKHITDRTTDPTTAEISEFVRFKVGSKNATPACESGVQTGSFGAAPGGGSFASEGSSTDMPCATDALTSDGSPQVGVVVKDDVNIVDPHHRTVSQNSTTPQEGPTVLTASIVTAAPSPHTPSSPRAGSPILVAAASPLTSVKRRLGGGSGDASLPQSKQQQNGPRLVTYVHCKAGCARSYIVATAYLISQHGRTLQEADKYMRALRPQFNPSEQQIEFLRAFEDFVSRPYVRPPSVEEERYQQVLADILSLSPEMRARLLNDVEKLT